MTEEYEGSKNWETWNINLWLNNDESMYNHSIELSRIEDKKDRVNGFYDYVYDLLDEKIIKDKISIHRVDFEEISNDFVEHRIELESYEEKRK